MIRGFCLHRCGKPPFLLDKDLLATRGTELASLGRNLHPNRQNCGAKRSCNAFRVAPCRLERTQVTEPPFTVPSESTGGRAVATWHPDGMQISWRMPDLAQMPTSLAHRPSSWHRLLGHLLPSLHRRTMHQLMTSVFLRDKLLEELGDE
jgi:hypothetical protein